MLLRKLFKIWLQSTIATELWDLVFGRLLACHQTLQQWTKCHTSWGKLLFVMKATMKQHNKPINSQSLSVIVISATAGLMVTCCSTSPGRVVRLRKKFSTFSAIIWLLVIATKKHCRRCVFENGPTSWPMIAVKSLLPGRNKFNVLRNTSVVRWSLIPSW